MAIVNFCPQKRQTKGALQAVINYVLREEKLNIEGYQFIDGQNCCPPTAYNEFITTKQSWKKTDGVQFYHFVQSFHPEENLTFSQANEIGLELAKQFEGYEVLVATHVDTDHIHNHLVVNSVSFETGKKLHQNRETLMAHRRKSDEICLAHGLTVLPSEPLKQKSKRMTPKEYQVALRENSWKFHLIAAIEDALLYSPDKETFIRNMEYEGYEVKWTDTRKNITYTCPNGMKCRDNKLHDDTYLKENLELLFAYRAEYGHVSQTPEPESGWLEQAESMAPQVSVLGATLQLGNSLGQMGEPAYTPRLVTQTDRKLRQREQIKKLAQGYELMDDQDQNMNYPINYTLSIEIAIGIFYGK